MSTTNTVRSIIPNKGLNAKPTTPPLHCSSSVNSASSSSGIHSRRETLLTLGALVSVFELPAEAMNYKEAVRERNARRAAMREAAEKLKAQSSREPPKEQ